MRVRVSSENPKQARTLQSVAAALRLKPPCKSATARRSAAAAMASGRHRPRRLVRTAGTPSNACDGVKRDTASRPAAVRRSMLARRAVYDGADDDDTTVPRAAGDDGADDDDLTTVPTRGCRHKTSQVTSLDLSHRRTCGMTCTCTCACTCGSGAAHLITSYLPGYYSSTRVVQCTDHRIRLQPHYMCM